MQAQYLTRRFCLLFCFSIPPPYLCNRMVNWSHVIGTYLPHLFTIGICALLGLVIHQVIEDTIHSQPDESSATVWSNTLLVLGETRNLLVTFFHSVVVQFHFQASETSVSDDYKSLFSAKVKIAFLVLCLLLWIAKNDNSVYLMSYATFKAPESWKVSHDQICEMMRRQKCFTEDSIDFMKRILARSGTGQSTAWPPGIVQCLEDHQETDNSIEGSRKEAELVIFDIVESALKKAKVHPKEIDVLVINCSLFSPTPSLCAMVISKFGMRSDILSFNLSGMGCGASLISVDLARKMLQNKGSMFGGGKALVVSTEIITPNLYHGNDRAFLLQNTLFRCGGAAMVLSNKWADGMRAMYKLLHIVRVQGNDEKSYSCVYETQDDKGKKGVSLSKDIVKVAGKCMEKNMTMLGPYVLPLTEQAKVVISIAARYALKGCKRILMSMDKEDFIKKLPVVRPYVPDFKRGIDHFCIHAGGRAVIDGIEKNMKLEEFHTEPSRAALLNFGNTSSSSIWYELEYIQELQQTNPLKKGDRIMQVAFGSGFKCTSGVWLKL
jgi:predicted naringenin-chalcone synthase